MEIAFIVTFIILNAGGLFFLCFGLRILFIGTFKVIEQGFSIKYFSVVLIIYLVSTTLGLYWLDIYWKFGFEDALLGFF
jgi:hypothetical protein